MYMGSEEVPTLFVRRASGLVRTVGPFTAFMIVFSHVVGGGIHKMAVLGLYTAPGADIPLAFLLTGILLALPTALIYTLMGAMMPRTGGDYIFITRGLNPAMGFIASWAFWVKEAVSYGLLSWMSVDFFAGAITAAGIALRDSSLLGMAKWMVTIQGHLVLGFAFALIFGLIAYLGMRVYGWVINILGVIAVIGCLTNVIILGIWGLAPMGAVRGWDSLYGPGAYEKIVNKAFEIGMAKGKLPLAPFSITDTMNTTSGAVFAYLGITAAVYVGGELKTPVKSLFVAQTLGTVIIMLYYVGLPFIAYSAYTVPQEILAKVPGALDYLAKSNIPANRVYFTSLYNYLISTIGAKKVAELIGVPDTYLLPPSAITSFTIPLVPRGLEWLQVINGAFVGIVLLKDLPAFFLVATRIVFAWAFDRFFPEMFAAVDSRFHSPYWAITLTLVFGILFLLLPYFGSDWAVAGVSSNLAMFTGMLGCLAGAVLPYTRRDLYEKSPITWSIAGVPALTIIGIWGWAANFLFFLISATQVQVIGMLLISIFLGVGATVYVAFLAYNEKRGIDIRTIYTELPPA
jgi:amino acid transporter